MTKTYKFRQTEEGGPGEKMRIVPYKIIVYLSRIFNKIVSFEYCTNFELVHFPCLCYYRSENRVTELSG